MLSILRNRVEGVIAVDRALRVLLMNQAARRFLGAGDSDLIGQPIDEIGAVGSIPEILGRVIRDGQAERNEVVLPSPDGGHALELHSTPLSDDDEVTVGAVVVLHDVSDLHRLEEVRREFVANVSQELKTPLTAIRGFVETLLDDNYTEVSTRRRFLGKIRDHSNRLSSLVSDLLTLSRVETRSIRPNAVPIDLRESVRASATLLLQRAEEKGLTITLHLPNEPVCVLGDLELLRQVTDNLVDNAVKFTAADGQVRLSLVQEPGVAVLEVTDTGVGLEPEHHQRIFERFYRVGPAQSPGQGGAGLGLSIVKYAVIAHEGRISVDSEPGKGSTFRIELPLAPAGLGEDERAEAPEAGLNGEPGGGAAGACATTPAKDRRRGQPFELPAGLDGCFDQQPSPGPAAANARPQRPLCRGLDTRPPQGNIDPVFTES